MLRICLPTLNKRSPRDFICIKRNLQNLQKKILRVPCRYSYMEANASKLKSKIKIDRTGTKNRMKAPICTCVCRGLFVVGPLAGQCFCRRYDYRSTDTRKKVTGEKIHLCKNFTGAAEAAVPSWHFEMNDQTSSDVSL